MLISAYMCFFGALKIGLRITCSNVAEGSEDYSGDSVLP